MTTSHLDQALDIVVTHLRQAFPSALAIYAFGSRMTGQSRADSDLDLALLVPGYASPLVLWETAQQLTGQLNIAVDLLDLRAASTVMQHQVLTTGQRLWGIDPQAALFECFIMSEKIRLDEARQPMLDDVIRSGRIYGTAHHG